ncbi:hypothetical protein EDD36DRAFT_238196 [Exophiala viscosa]|uniref:Uncharacterized protein n=1 Tax=Exophiala viscosa TaxID=2486360 RepID=A0AAN6DVQ8_9EURO|nr:hypothetical protein EDD36DRAFT_238196 [Exophiala viscosa]
MDFLRHHWYDLGAGVAAYSTYYVYTNQKRLSQGEKLVIASFIAVCLHQVEEYRFPGGFPISMNLGHQHSPKPDRYPLNAHSALITNAGATYLYYLPAIFYPDCVWLALGPMLSSFSQLVIHGININRSMGTLYNPGLGTTILLMYPNGIQYIMVQQRAGLLGLREWVYAVISLVLFTYITLVKWTFTWAPDLNSPHPFSHAEMTRWGSPSFLVKDYLA